MNSRRKDACKFTVTNNYASRVCVVGCLLSSSVPRASAVLQQGPAAA